MTKLTEKLAECLVLAIEDGRPWLKNELTGLINRLKVSGGHPSGIAVQSLTNGEKQMKPGTYRITPGGTNLIPDSEKKMGVVAEVKETVSESTREMMFDTLRSMDDDELKKHFGKKSEMQKFITDHGGTIHASANTEATITVLRELIAVDQEEE